MGKLVYLYVEGKSDKVFFEGIKFQKFISDLGYSTKVKNLRTKGNVLSNFERFLRLESDRCYASILVYDRDCQDFDTREIERITKSYNKTFHCIAIEELEAWYIADSEEILRINPTQKPYKNTEGIGDPKSWLKKFFEKSNKGFKEEIGLAEHFGGRINLSNARKCNNSLHEFLIKFENKFN